MRIAGIGKHSPDVSVKSGRRELAQCLLHGSDGGYVLANIDAVVGDVCSEDEVVFGDCQLRVVGLA